MAAGGTGRELVVTAAADEAAPAAEGAALGGKRKHRRRGAPSEAIFRVYAWSSDYLGVC